MPSKYGLLLQPMLLLQGLYDYTVAWALTRRWLFLTLVHGPWLLVLLISTGFIVFGGIAVKQDALIKRYENWIAQEIPLTLEKLAPPEPAAAEVKDEPLEFVIGTEAAKPAASNAPQGKTNAETDSASNRNDAEQEKATGSEEPEEISPHVELLLKRRVLLSTPEPPTSYLAAKNLAADSRLGQARHIMRSLAPLDAAGFGPAHAWLAFDNLQPNALESKEDLAEVTHDLEVVVSGKNVDPKLVAAYASLLESTGKPADAINALERVRDEESSLAINMRIAQLSAKHGRALALSRASELIKSELRTRMEQGISGGNDFADLAHLFLLEENPAQARKVALRGLGREADHLELKRLLSESYRIEYLLNLRRDPAKPTFDVKLLNAAYESDPTNPAISIETAKLVALGQEVAIDLRSDLEARLSDGSALAMAHIITADGLLVKGDLLSAIPHLEIAIKKDPENPAVMNNLALALAKTDPQTLDRALELSMSATSKQPTNLEFIDTLGEIRALSGDKVGAVECYEFVVRGDGSRKQTRQRLAEIYRELGMIDLAEIQERVLEPSIDP